MPKYILVESYRYDMSNNAYEDYQPIRSCQFYDNLEQANTELNYLQNRFHTMYDDNKYQFNYEDGTYYSEKYNQTVYPPKVYKIEE